MPLPISSPSLATSTASPGLEAAVDLGDPDRQQARAALAQDPGGAGVDEQTPARRLGVLEPELEAGLPALPAPRSGCRPPPRRPPPSACPASVPLQITAGIPGLARHLRRGDLAAHAARAEGRGAVADLHARRAGRSR